MDKKKALEILELKEDVSSEEIENRIAVLYKKFKQGGSDLRGYTLEDVEKAYMTVSGRIYTNTEEEKKQRYRREHPNPILKTLKVDEEKARNFLYYYKWHGIIILLVILVVVSIINSLANRDNPNLKVLIGGNIYISDPQVIEERIALETEGIINAQVQNIFLSGEQNSEMEMAMHTKFAVELAAGNNDIFILDETKYFELAEKGVFKPVETLFEDINTLGFDLKRSEDLYASVYDEGEKNEKYLYGIDISDNKMLKDVGLQGERFILALGHTGENSNNTIIFINKLLE